MEYQIIYQLILATLLGALIGLEREVMRKEAGLRTYSLVSLGTCLFTIISLELFQSFTSTIGVSFDPTRIIQAIASGIGFIGAGVIFRQQSGVVGITTAAALWVVAAIGLAVGSQLYLLAIFTTFMTLLILFALRLFEEEVLDKKE
jgi:putative Mg2+ transporter-C (MgtC) family protein